MRARRLLGSGGRWEEEEESKLPFPGAAGEPPPPPQCPRERPPSSARRGAPGVGRGSAGGRGARGIGPFPRLGASLPRFVRSPAARLAPAVPGAGLCRRPALGRAKTCPASCWWCCCRRNSPVFPPLRLGFAGGLADGQLAEMPLRSAATFLLIRGGDARRQPGGRVPAGERPCRAPGRGRQPLASPGDPPGRAVRSFSCPSSPPGRAAHAWLSLYNCGTARRG